MGIAINGVKDVVTFPFKVGFGALSGFGHGLSDGMLAKPGVVLAPLSGELPIYAPVRNTVRNFIAGGFHEMRAPESIIQAFNNLKNVKLNGLMAAFSKMGPKGLIMFGLIGAATVLVGKLGWDVIKGEKHIIDEIDRGHVAHIVNNKLFHFARGFSGLGMLGGAILSVIPGGAVLGIPMAIAGTAGSAVLHWGGKFANGFHGLNYPNTLGFFGRRAVRTFNELSV